MTSADAVWDALPPFRRAIQLAPAVYLVAALILLAAVAAVRLGWKTGFDTAKWFALLREWVRSKAPERKAKPKAEKKDGGKKKDPPAAKPTESKAESGTVAAFAAVRRRTRR